MRPFLLIALTLLVISTVTANEAQRLLDSLEHQRRMRSANSRIKELKRDIERIRLDRLEFCAENPRLC